ncbi:class I SAM-dependent methyltransferase [Luminiphilus sp.]|nr:class I SAM-dependent methyltransferase [Luminiphilus sp.]
MWLLIFESENLWTKAPLNCLEIGSWQGLSALFLLTQLPLANLICVDTWGEKGSAENGQRTDLASNALSTFKKNLAAHSAKCNAFQGTSDHYFANRHVETRFDFIYIDGSHRAEQVLKDAVNSFSSLRRDGIMIFDDLGWKQRRHVLGNPAAGIIAFLNLHQGSFKVIACTSKQLAIKKTKTVSTT